MEALRRNDHIDHCLGDSPSPGALSKPYIANKAVSLGNRKKDIYKLFHLPLIIGVALLCFAHGANDVANAVGPLAAIVSTLNETNTLQAKVGIPFWVMVIGAIGIALGLALFGPKLIKTVGEKITKLNAARAYCVALSSAVTVLIATHAGAPREFDTHRHRCDLWGRVPEGVSGAPQTRRAVRGARTERVGSGQASQPRG